MATIVTRAGKGAPLTHAEVDANFVNLNADIAGSLNRANHTGTQAASTITGLAAVATSGSATDLGTGTLPAARFNDTAHGNRAGGALHAAATTSVNGFMSSADKTKLDGVATGATANATDAQLRDRATHTGTQTAGTISDFNASARGQVEAALVAGSGVTITPSGSGATRQLTIAATGGGGGGGTPGSSPAQLYSFTDFIGAPGTGFSDGSLFQGQQAGTGAGTAITQIDEAPGWLNFNLGTVATNRVASSFQNGIILGFGQSTWKCRIRHVTLSDDTNANYVARLGYIDSVGANPVDGCFFRYTHSVNGGNWQAVTRSNNAETASDTGITAAAATTYTFEVRVNDAGTSVEFLIDGTTVATHTANIPTGLARETGAGIALVRSAGTVATTAIAADYQWIDHRSTVVR